MTDVLVIGFGPARSFSTGLCEILGSCGVYVPPGKELNLLLGQPFDAARYEKTFLGHSSKVAIDYCVDYCTQPNVVLQNIKKIITRNTSLDVRFIFLYREPYARLVSHYRFLLNLGRQSDLAKKIALESSDPLDWKKSIEKIQSLDRKIYPLNTNFKDNLEAKEILSNFLVFVIPEISVDSDNVLEVLTKTVGARNRPRFLLIEKMRDKVWHFLVEIDLLAVIKLFKTTGLKKFYYKYLTVAEENQNATGQDSLFWEYRFSLTESFVLFERFIREKFQ